MSTARQSAPVIQTLGLAKRYGDVQALKGVDLTVREGEVFGFLGPNGSGKTTTIRLLTGFIRATSGRALVFGMDVWRDRVSIARGLGFLPDSGGLDEGRTGRDLLDYLTVLQGRPPRLQDELLDRLEFPRRALRRRIKTYSQGMRQKLALVQALQHDPALVILDEPTTGLDPLVQQTFFSIVEDLKARGRTVFMSSHVLSEVERLCDRVGIIRAGELAAVERVEEMRRRRVRVMEVTFRGDLPRDGVDLPGVLSASREGRQVRLTVQGDVNPLVRSLARYDLEDLVFGPARLEDIFLAFYQGDGGDNA